MGLHSPAGGGASPQRDAAPVLPQLCLRHQQGHPQTPKAPSLRQEPPREGRAPQPLCTFPFVPPLWVFSCVSAALQPGPAQRFLQKQLRVWGSGCFVALSFDISPGLGLV